MSRFTAPVIGGAFGAWSQDIGENPYAGTAGAAIGAYAGHRMSSDLGDLYKKFRPERMSIDSLRSREVDMRAAQSTALDSALESLGKTFQGNVIDGEMDPSILRHNMSTMFDEKFASYSNDTIHREVVNYMDANRGDRKKVLELRDVLSNNRKINAVSGPGAGGNELTKIPIKPGDSIENIESKIFKHLSEDMNNPKDIAAAKAKDLAPALHGKSAEIEGHALNIHTPQGVRNERIPLTAYKPDGTKFTRHNGIDFAVRSFNPFGEMFAEGKQLLDFASGNSNYTKITAQMATEKFDPEELVGLFHKYNNGIGDSDWSTIARKASSLSIYSAADSRMPQGATFHDMYETGYGKRISNTLDMNIAFNQADDGSVKIGKMDTSIKPGNMRSTYSEFLNRISNQLEYNPQTGQSVNSLGLITAPGDAFNQYTPGLFHAEARGSTSVSYRDHAPYRPSSSHYLQQKAATDSRVNSLRASASHGYRIHSSELMGRAVSDLFGNKLTIDDGHGLANPVARDHFSARQLTSVNIGNVGDSTAAKYMLSMNLPEGLMNKSQQGIRAALMNTNITAYPGQILGYDKSRRAAKLKNHFSSGRLIDIVKNEEGMNLVFAGKHEPQDWTKIFGTSSKSGLSFTDSVEQFADIGALSLAESRGHITPVESKGSVKWKMNSDTFGDKYKGKAIGTANMLKELKAQPFYKDYRKEAGQAHMIQGWDDVGQKNVNKFLNGNAKDTYELIAELKTSLKGKGLDSELQELSKLGFSQAERSEKANILRTILATSGDKSSQDMFLTAAEHAARTGNKSDVSFLNYLESKDELISRGIESKSNLITPDERNRLRGILKKAHQGLEGKSYTQFTPNMGEAIHGAGKTGSMSRLEHGMLRSLGHDMSIFDKVTTQNSEALYELSLIHKGDQKGNMSYKSFAQGTDVSDAITGVFNTKAEDRLGYLRRAGLNPSIVGESLRYDLANPVNGFKSVAIGLMETGHTGLKDYGGKDILMEMEKARQSLIHADIGLSNANTSAMRKQAKLNLNAAAERLVDIEMQAMSGDNNLKKEAGKRMADGSIIATARPIGGSANKSTLAVNATKKRNARNATRNIAFISEDMAKKIYKDAGLDYDKHVIDHGKGIKSLMSANGNNLMAQVSREPVQGPFSTMGLELRVDTSLSGNSKHLYIPQSSKLLNAFAFLDYDADHLRMLPMMGLTGREEEKYMKKNAQLVQHAEDMLKIQDKLGVKGASKHLDVLSQFNNIGEKSKHMMNAGELARLRKIDSPEVTRIVEEFGAALDIEGLDGKRGLMPRVLAHNLTENLLKSSHKEVGGRLTGAVQEIEEAQLEYKSHLDKEKYRKRMTSIIDNTIGGEVDQLSDVQKNIYRQGLDDLISAHIDHGSEVQTFMGQKNARRATTQSEVSQMIEDTAFQGGDGPVPSRESGVTPRSVKNASNKMKNDVGRDTMALLAKNKKLLAASAIGLGAIAMLSRDTPDQLASTSPGSSKGPVPLKPLPNESAHVRKYNPRKQYSTTAEVRAPRSGINSGTIDRAIFGDRAGQVSVNINDKNGNF